VYTARVRVHGPYTAVYMFVDMDRVQDRVHGPSCTCCSSYTQHVHDRVHWPTRPVRGRVHAHSRPVRRQSYTCIRVHSRHKAVYAPCARPLHGRVHGPYAAVYTCRVHGPYTAVYVFMHIYMAYTAGRVHAGTRLCTRVQTASGLCPRPCIRPAKSPTRAMCTAKNCRAHGPYTVVYTCFKV